MKTTRTEVYAAIDSEREYQDRRWNPETTPCGGQHSPQEFLTYIDDYTREALHIGSRESDFTCVEKQLNCLRKIAALAVAAMEQHGAPRR